ncbi:hypothetical protein WMF11_08330 [Sorangium sp. So ce295]|uniref:hypothetical protein n=1 Tax=Sorangium sp. So ce295 TaxID=3133295 RepID=UPI003F648C40
MTVRSVSWTDAQRVTSLLARVTTTRSREPATLVTAMGAGRAGAPGKAAPVPAKAAPKEVKQVKEVPRLVQTSDNPADRLDTLVAWTLDHHPCVGAFVADDNGLTLAAHGISEAHVSLVGPLLSALVGVRSIPGVDATAGALWLGAQMMSWVEARTARGGFCLGTVGDEALSTRSFEQLKEALATTLRGL